MGEEAALLGMVMFNANAECLWTTVVEIQRGWLAASTAADGLFRTIHINQ